MSQHHLLQGNPKESLAVRGRQELVRIKDNSRTSGRTSPLQKVEVEVRIKDNSRTSGRTSPLQKVEVEAQLPTVTPLDTESSILAEPQLPPSLPSPPQPCSISAERSVENLVKESTWDLNQNGSATLGVSALSAWGNHTVGEDPSVLRQRSKLSHKRSPSKNSKNSKRCTNGVKRTLHSDSRQSDVPQQYRHDITLETSALNWKGKQAHSSDAERQQHESTRMRLSKKRGQHHHQQQQHHQHHQQQQHQQQQHQQQQHQQQQHQQQQHQQQQHPHQQQHRQHQQQPATRINTMTRSQRKLLNSSKNVSRVIAGQDISWGVKQDSTLSQIDWKLLSLNPPPSSTLAVNKQSAPNHAFKTASSGHERLKLNYETQQRKKRLPRYYLPNSSRREESHVKFMSGKNQHHQRQNNQRNMDFSHLRIDCDYPWMPPL
jgi:hypothetical protein